MTRPTPENEPRFGFLPGETPLNNVLCYLDRNADQFPERPALRWVTPRDLRAWDGSVRRPLPHASLSYGDFVAGIRRTAKGLADLGRSTGDRAIIFLPMSAEMYTALFAVQRIGAMAVLTKQELLLPIVGGLFVLEAMSVILQVGSFKLRGKRIFRMAPLHHHFELKGWSESKVTIRFWIIALMFALLSLSTLKLR